MTSVEPVNSLPLDTQPVSLGCTAVKVLYLDDDPIDRTLMQMHIKRHLRLGTVKLQCVGTIDEARDAMACEAFDYLVTDHRMPPITSYRETLDLLDLGSFRGRIIVVSSEMRLASMQTDLDPRIYCMTDKADLSGAIKNGLFESLAVA